LADGDAGPARGGATCGQCGATSPKGYRFCLGCGAVLEAGERVGSSGHRQPRARLGTSRGVEAAGAAAVTTAQAAARAPDKPALEPLPAQRVLPVGEEPVASVACASCGAHVSQAVSACPRCGATIPKHTDRGLGKDRPPESKGRPPVSLPSPGRRAAEEREPTGLPFELIAKRRRVSEPALAEPAKPTGRTDRPTRKPAQSEAQAPTARLVVIVEDGSEGAAVDLAGDQLDIGRCEGDILFAEDRYMSPRHARLLRRDGAWYVRDLASVNGVYRRIRGPEVLRDRDLLLLGLEVVEFQLVDHAERGLGHAVQHGTLVFGSPAASRPARLCQRTVEGVVRDVYYLVADETTVGRETGDLVFTSDPFMSRRHACIQWQEANQRYVLTDLSSSNGTYLAIRGDLRLEHGDFIRLGQHLFRLDLLTPGASTRSGPR
jgi:pSer/pThr/pTyr-binding forkhead associated (FHA) protein